MSVNDQIEAVFPGLRSGNYQIKSPADISYNCIAWAVGENHKCWWPTPRARYFWPKGLSRISSIDSFVEAFRSLGFEECDNVVYENGYEKIALFAKDNRPTHGARQLESGLWTI